MVIVQDILKNSDLEVLHASWGLAGWIDLALAIALGR